MQLSKVVTVLAAASLALTSVHADGTAVHSLSMRRLEVNDTAALAASGSAALTQSPDLSGLGGSGSVPKAPGPQVDETTSPHATTHAPIPEDEPKARSALFSIFFFIASATTLAAILYKFPTKKSARKVYEPMTSA